VETADPHLERVKPRFDVAIDVVDPTVQPQPKEAGSIAELIDEKHRLGEVVFLTKPMKNAAAGFVPWQLNTSTLRSNLVSTSISAYNQDHSPLILTAVSSTATRVGFTDGGSGTRSDSRCNP
jgi:hypothetical protein